jgi:hypothetical protein
MRGFLSEPGFGWINGFYGKRHQYGGSSFSVYEGWLI